MGGTKDEIQKNGRTGLYISEISLGSWLTYGNSTDKETAVKVIDTAYSSESIILTPPMYTPTAELKLLWEKL